MRRLTLLAVIGTTVVISVASCHDSGLAADATIRTGDAAIGLVDAMLGGADTAASPADATVSPPDAGGCNAVVPGPNLDILQIDDNPLFATGGTIPDGRYVAVVRNNFTGPDGSSVTLFGAGDGEAIAIDGSTWQWARRPPGDAPLINETFSVVNTSPTLQLTRTCPAAATLSVGYSMFSSPTEIVISTQLGDGVTSVVGYQRQP